MSGGTACRCAERTRPLAVREWCVLVRRANYSAFNGYRRTPSDWSSLQCRVCGAVWRTRAAYVSQLRNHPAGKRCVRESAARLNPGISPAELHKAIRLSLADNGREK